MTTTTHSTSRNVGLGSLVISLLVLSLLAFYFWPRQGDLPLQGEQRAASAGASDAGAAGSAATRGGANAGSRQASPGIVLDANGHRVLNSAGLPLSNEPLPEARPLPVRAAPGEVIGYSTDAQGVSKPLRAGELTAVPNSPGTYAVVDMWGDTGYEVVAPTRVGRPLTPTELAEARRAERHRERELR